MPNQTSNTRKQTSPNPNETVSKDIQQYTVYQKYTCGTQFASVTLKQMFNHTFSVLAIYKRTQKSPNHRSQHTRVAGALNLVQVQLLVFSQRYFLMKTQLDQVGRLRTVLLVSTVE